jgi:hypothetical protein
MNTAEPNQATRRSVALSTAILGLIIIGVGVTGPA